jgi:hypothetical protein
MRAVSTHPNCPPTFDIELSDAARAAAKRHGRHPVLGLRFGVRPQHSGGGRKALDDWLSGLAFLGATSSRDALWANCGSCQDVVEFTSIFDGPYQVS